MNIEHIFFDLDRTLWDFDENSKQTLIELHQRYLSETEIHFDSFFACYQEINHRLWDQYNKHTITKEELRKLRFKNTLQFFNINDVALASQLEKEYIDTTPNRTKLIDGAEEVLDYLSSKFRLHIITNGFNEVQHHKIKHSGIANYFDVIITSDTAGINKPNPNLFIHSLNRASAVPENSLMIGDDLQNDVLPALSINMQAVWYNPENKKAATDVVSIDRLPLLKALL